MTQNVDELLGKVNEAVDASKEQTQASKALADEVKGIKPSIEQKMAAALVQFDEWRNDKDIVGDKVKNGTIRQAIFQGCITGAGGVFSIKGDGDFEGKVDDLKTTENIFIHFKTPYNVNNDNAMFWFNIRGYAYHSSKIIDETIVGYCYNLQKSLINKSSFGNLNPDSYKDSAGNIIIRIKIPNIHFTTLAVDTMKVGLGDLLEHGSLDVKLSLAETIDF
ncbi:MAG: hypothetical protein ACPGUD_06355 [Parashewanella sp.]